jgi:hypothetical protein
MLPSVARSRRALVAATAALAAAPVVTAKKKKGKKKKTPAPLAYAVARVTDLSSRSGTLQISFEGYVKHVASGYSAGFSTPNANIPFITTSTALVSHIQNVAANLLESGLAITVPEERIAVTIL